MWYENSLKSSIQAIRNYKGNLSEKEYRIMAKESNLLGIHSLRFITNLTFAELVKQVHEQSA